MSQAYITDPEMMDKRLCQAESFRVPVPPHFYLHSMKFSISHCIKVLDFDHMCELFKLQGRRMREVIKPGKVDADYVGDFVASQLESVAAKLLSKVTAKDVENDDGSQDDKLKAISRIRLFDSRAVQTPSMPKFGRAAALPTRCCAQGLWRLVCWEMP